MQRASGQSNENYLHDLLTVFRLLEDQPIKLAALLSRFDSPADVIAQALGSDASDIPTEMATRIKRKYKRELLNTVEGDLRWLEGDQHNIIVLGDTVYPSLLAEISDPPVILFCRGNLEVLNAFKIALVGSRNPTRMGVRNAVGFAQELVSSGIAITSGLALGIDGASHRGALDAGGTTIAVLGSGCDLIYPTRHRDLADQIQDKGLIISEFPLGTGAYPGNFPRRNRIVTGLSLGTLVVEAQERSGSLISARLAMEQGREVFAIPGPIQSRQSRGCHRLIRDGATLVENAEQILQDVSSLAKFEIQTRSVEPVSTAARLSELKMKLLQILEIEPTILDDLCRMVDREVQEVMSNLVELEIDGFVVSDAKGYSLANTQ